VPFQDFREFLDALREHGLEYVEVADVPGWQDDDFPELRKHPSATK